MLFRIFLSFLCLTTFFSNIEAAEKERFSKAAPVPKWIKTYAFPLEPIPLKPSQINLQYLLFDTQKNWEEKTKYQHVAIRALTQSGVQEISQLKYYFDPPYNQLLVHKIQIYRNGEWLDRLKTSRHQLIQREENLEKNLYDGNLCLIYFLDDVREGDILEYSYSLIGEHPLSASHYKDNINLQYETSVEKVSYRLLIHPDRSFLIQPLNTEAKPQTCDLSRQLREWIWEATDTPARLHEPNQPFWYYPRARVEVSEYKSWQEVVQKLVPLFTLADNFKLSASPGMLALIDSWKAETQDLSQRALLALKFVQDEVRYLGFEEGISSVKPNDPNIIFQRRFGDCKDKAFLLHALLYLMDIQSIPLLVHSWNGKALPDALPSTSVFNHAVLQIKIDDATYFVDPTISLQGGSLSAISFPQYHWGLLISPMISALTPLPQAINEKPVYINTSLVLTSEDSALLTLKSTFHGERADRLRRSLKWKGLKKISDDGLAEYQEIYGQVVIHSPMEVSDDRENNTIDLIETYQLPIQEDSDGKAVALLTYILRYYLQDRVNPERTSPFALAYPLWVKEHIHIENPFANWDPYEKSYAQEHESLLYAYSMQVNGSQGDFDFELKHLQDHVPSTSVRDYWNIVNDIVKTAPSKMPIPAPIKQAEHSFLLVPYSIMALLVWPGLYSFYRKKRSTQDMLSFYFIKFRSFFLVIGISIIALTSSSVIPCVVWPPFLFILLHFSFNKLILSRSPMIILFWQVIAGIQIVVLSVLLFINNDPSLTEKALAFIALIFYLGYSLEMLRKAKAFLSAEADTNPILSPMP